MNNVIGEDNIKNILKCYPAEYHDTLKHQLDTMNSILSINMKDYTLNDGYRKAMDEIIRNIAYGKFIDL